MKTCNFLFGYGTLRTDLGSYSSPTRFIRQIGFGRTLGELWCIGNAYGTWAGAKEVRPTRTKAMVYGEVFEVDPTEWEVLDRREQATADPPFYYRKIVPVTLVSGDVVQAQIYFAGRAHTSWLQRIVSGDWADYLKEKNPEGMIGV